MTFLVPATVADAFNGVVKERGQTTSSALRVYMKQTVDDYRNERIRRITGGQAV